MPEVAEGAGYDKVLNAVQRSLLPVRFLTHILYWKPTVADYR